METGANGEIILKEIKNENKDKDITANDPPSLQDVLVKDASRREKELEKIEEMLMKHLQLETETDDNKLFNDLVLKASAGALSEDDDSTKDESKKPAEKEQQKKFIYEDEEG